MESNHPFLKIVNNVQKEEYPIQIILFIFDIMAFTWNFEPFYIFIPQEKLVLVDKGYSWPSKLDIFKEA